IEVYKHSARLLPGFALVVLLQMVVALIVFIPVIILTAILASGMLVLFIMLTLTWLYVAQYALIWFYFAQYALVFDGRRSWYALLHSRELMKGRFLRVAVRIVVFLAVWSGYNAWASGAFVVASVLLGPV